MQLKQRFLQSVLWSLLERFSGLFIQLICSIIIARQLEPSEFGLVGMLTIFSTVALMIIQGGYSQTLIQKQDCTDAIYSSTFFINIALGFILYALLFFSSPLIALFYDSPELTHLSWALFSLLPIASLGLIQRTILTKKMNFKALTMVSLWASILSGILGVVLAYYLKNAWALVAQLVASQSLQVIFLWFYSSWRPCWRFSFKGMKQISKQALPLMLSQVIGSFFGNLYALIIGKFFSPIDLGYYTQAARMQTVSSNTLTDVIQKVSFALLSTLQNDSESLKNYYRRIFETCLFVVVPTMFLLILLAPNLIPILLSEKWIDAVPFFQILCVAGALYPLNLISLNILLVKGMGKQMLILEITRETLMVLCICLTIHLSILHFLAGYVVYNGLCAILNMFFSGRIIKLSIWYQLKHYIPIFALSSFALALCYFRQNYIAFPSPYLSMVVDCLVFGGLYLLGSRMFRWPHLKNIINLTQK